MSTSLSTIKESGVTFIEVMVVIALIAILASIAMPFYGDYIQRQRLVGAAESALGQLQLAKRAAISNNSAVNLLVSGAGASWCMTYSTSTAIDSGCSGGYVTSTSNPSTRLLSENYPGVSLSVSPTPFSLQFQMPGLSLSNNATLTFTTGTASLGNVVITASGAAGITACASEIGNFPGC